MRSPTRFQCDAQWQADFGRLALALAEMHEHVAAGLQCRDAGALDEARAELALADEAKDRIALLQHALADLT